MVLIAMIFIHGLVTNRPSKEEKEETICQACGIRKPRYKLIECSKCGFIYCADCRKKYVISMHESDLPPHLRGKTPGHYYAADLSPYGRGCLRCGEVPFGKRK